MFKQITIIIHIIILELLKFIIKLKNCNRKTLSNCFFLYFKIIINKYKALLLTLVLLNVKDIKIDSFHNINIIF